MYPQYSVKKADKTTYSLSSQTKFEAGLKAAQTIILPKANINTNGDIKFLHIERRNIDFGEQNQNKKPVRTDVLTGLEPNRINLQGISR